MVDLGPPRPPRSVAEALGTKAIPADLSIILALHSRTVREDGAACTLEVRLGQVIHSFLAELASEVDLVPGLERVTIAGLDPDGRVLLMHSILSLQGNI